MADKNFERVEIRVCQQTCHAEAEAVEMCCAVLCWSRTQVNDDDDDDEWHLAT